MNPCFEKLYRWATAHGACSRALFALHTCKDWDELCALPSAGRWAVWVVCKRPDLELAYQEFTERTKPLFEAYERDLGLAYRGARTAEEFVDTVKPIHEALDAALEPFHRAMIPVVRACFEPQTPTPTPTPTEETPC